MIQFPFNERKTAQAAAYLLKLCGGEKEYISIIKMLYLADRRTLIEIGQPITGDKIVSMDHGPVLSRVYDTIKAGKWEIESRRYWSEIISPQGSYNVVLKSQELDDDELSDYEVAVLRDIAELYGTMDWRVLVQYTHTLPEWTDPDGSAIPIDPRDILRAAGKSDAEIERVTADAESRLFMSELASNFE